MTSTVIAVLVSFQGLEAQDHVSEEIALIERVTRPLEPGKAIPKLVLRTADFKKFDLSKALEGQLSIVFFFRGDWCAYSGRMLKEFRNIDEELLKMDFQVIGVTPDRSFSLKSMTSKHGLGFVLLSDSEFAASSAFGLAYPLSTSLVEHYNSHNVTLVRLGEGKGFGMVAPAIYFIGRDGRILARFASPDYRENMAAEKIVELARRFKAREEIGLKP